MANFSSIRPISIPPKSDQWLYQEIKQVLDIPLKNISPLHFIDGSVPDAKKPSIANLRSNGQHSLLFTHWIPERYDTAQTAFEKIASLAT